MSVNSSPSPMLGYATSRTADRYARDRSTLSAGSEASAASWSARGAGGRCQGTSSTAVTTTAASRAIRATTAQFRGLMPSTLSCRS
jgi:hypothetical protein